MQKKPRPRPKPRPKKIKKPAISSTPPWSKTEASPSENQNESTENWKEEYEKLNKKYHFLMAEYANYKKHSMKQLTDLRKYEGQSLIQKLIDSVIDDFDRAVTQNLTENNIEEFRKGILMIYEKFQNLLKEIGVKELACEGQAFDPALHYALDSAPSKDIPPEHIIKVLKKAYSLHDKLLRPAEVIVSKQPPTDTPE